MDAAPAAVAVDIWQRDLLLLVVGADEQSVRLHPDVGVVKAEDERPARHPATTAARAGLLLLAAGATRTAVALCRSGGGLGLGVAGELLARPRVAILGNERAAVGEAAHQRGAAQVVVAAIERGG